MYEFAAPLYESNGPPALTFVPWNQLVLPTGELRFCNDHPLPASKVILSKFSVIACPQTAPANAVHPKSASEILSVEMCFIFFVNEVYFPAVFFPGHL